MADISTVESEAEAGVFNSFIDTRWLALHNQPFSVSAFRETLKVHFEPKGHENQFSIKYTFKKSIFKIQNPQHGAFSHPWKTVKVVFAYF